MSSKLGRRTALLAPLLVAGLVGAASAEEKPAYSASSGRVTFKMYCQNCHGEGGKGDGYIADTLRRRPTDLTRLAAGNGGVFPADEVAATIDGREEVKAHGAREMPLWGDVFLWPEGDSAERRESVRRRIGELVAFVQSLQEPAAAR